VTLNEMNLEKTEGFRLVDGRRPETQEAIGLRCGAASWKLHGRFVKNRDGMG